jgi:2-polyprenyl-3-methyl-5-hydroxy-6-metoxy-1,4-benzoquinol methylase
LVGNRRGRALDVGSGKGLLLADLRDSGWQVTGTELSEESSRQAISLGLDVRTTTVAEANLPPSHFDLITLFHVLEHLRDPRHELETLKRLLRPGGLLVVEVPNISSWYARTFGDAWFHFDVPRHLFHFNATTLTSIVKKCGFKVISLATHNVRYDAFGVVQSLLNLFIERQNLLNNLLTKQVTVAELWGDPKRIRTMAALTASEIALVVGFPLVALAGVLTSPWIEGGSLRIICTNDQ